ncbi:MAG: O-antigen ligase family protein [Desulfobulbaceae bacterium]|nr:O-antigen ligase family protein [Desulfobulbaceae bacterium]
MRIKQQPISLVFFFLLATIPLLFGARHPLIQGVYTALIFFTCGPWLVLNYGQIKPRLVNRAYLPVYLIILFVFFTSLPLPLSLIELLSPVRAGYLRDAASLAQLKNTVFSLSYYAPAARFYGFYFLGLLLYYLCAASLTRRNSDRRAVLWIIMALGSLEAVYGLLQAMIPDLGILWLPSSISAEGSARGTIIYRNQFAAFLNLCWPMTVALGILLYHPVISRFHALKNRKKSVSLADRLSLIFQKAALPFWSAAFMILAVIFSRSRGGIIIMLLMSIFFLLILPFSKRLKALAGGSLLLFIFFYGGMIGFQSVTDRFLAFCQGAQGRFLLWLDSLAILRDHMITGSGMGTYKFLSPVYLENLADTTWYDFAHNEYLELAIELGLPMAVLLFAWIILQVWRCGRRIIRMGGRIDTFTFFPENTILAIGSFCAITGFLLHGFVDFVWRLPVNAFYVVTIMALLNVASPSGQTDGNG